MKSALAIWAINISISKGNPLLSLRDSPFFIITFLGTVRGLGRSAWIVLRYPGIAVWVYYRHRVQKPKCNAPLGGVDFLR